MALLILKDVKKHFGAQEVLRGATLQLDPGQKVGLVGRKRRRQDDAAAHDRRARGPDWGSVTLRKGARVGSVPQRPAFAPGLSVRAYAEAGLEETRRVLARLEAVAEEMGAAEGAALERLMTEHERLTGRVEELGGWETERRVETVLSGIGLPPALWEREARTLSGGEKSRAALARELVSGHDLLLLDEPTNHLDLDGIEWIERYIRELPGAVLIVQPRPAAPEPGRGHHPRAGVRQPDALRGQLPALRGPEGGALPGRPAGVGGTAGPHPPRGVLRQEAHGQPAHGRGQGPAEAAEGPRAPRAALPRRAPAQDRAAQGSARRRAGARGGGPRRRLRRARAVRGDGPAHRPRPAHRRRRPQRGGQVDPAQDLERASAAPRGRGADGSRRGLRLLRPGHLAPAGRRHAAGGDPARPPRAQRARGALAPGALPVPRRRGGQADAGAVGGRTRAAVPGAPGADRAELAGARRAHQPPGPGRAHGARRDAGRVPGRPGLREPRPRVPGRAVRPHRRGGRRRGQLVPRQLLRVAAGQG